MVNQKGQFPLDARVSTRVSGRTKRLLKKLKEKGHSENDVITYGALKLSDEPLLLDWEIGELDAEIKNLKSILFELENRKQAKLNRLKIINPKLIDDDTLNSMLVDSARDYAQEIFDSHGEGSCEMLEKRKNSVRVAGEEFGYDPSEFLDEVRVQLKNILSDNSV